MDRPAALVTAPNPTAPLAGLWPLLLLIALLWLLGQILTSLIRWTCAAQTERVQDHLHALIHRPGHPPRSGLLRRVLQSLK